MKSALVLVILCLSSNANAFTTNEVSKCSGVAEMQKRVEATYDRMILKLSPREHEQLFGKMNQKLEERIAASNSCQSALAGIQDVLKGINTALDEIEKFVHAKINSL